MIFNAINFQKRYISDKDYFQKRFNKMFTINEKKNLLFMGKISMEG